MEDFNTERAAKACGNVSGLCDWVKAMHSYFHIARIVGPKTDKLREEEGKLRMANSKLQGKE
eukprot:gene4132-biopygen3951